jgi:hypothetical protein
MRDDKGRYLAGVSGNPTGRPKVIGELKELASIHTPQAIQTLADVMNDKEAPHAARVAASTALLDRVYGRPSQNVEARIETVDMGKAAASVLMDLANRAKLRKAEEAEELARANTIEANYKDVTPAHN